MFDIAAQGASCLLPSSLPPVQLDMNRGAASRVAQNVGLVCFWSSSSPKMICQRDDTSPSISLILALIMLVIGKES